MKHKWTMIFSSVAVFTAAGQEAHAESRGIGCASIPYVRHWLDTNATIPRCSVEHVSDPSRTYAIYRDVTMHGRSMAVIVVLYKASRGDFSADPDADRAMLGRQQDDASPENANLPWAFDGFLKSPPEKVEAGPGPRTYRFEAPVAVFNGAVANCWAGFKDSIRAADNPSPRSATVYAVALTCAAKDYGGVLSDDTAYKPIWNITLK